MNGVKLRSDIGLVNRTVTMGFVCKLIGMPDVDYAVSGAKVECPFGPVFHPDGGKAFRIYENASAYCYACGEKYSPVQLYALAKDISLDDAADQLLELSGYKPATAEDRFEAAAADLYVVDQNAMAAALKTYCARVYPDWEQRETDEDVAAMLVRCVELVPRIHTAEESQVWLAAAKKAMATVLGDTTA